MRVPDRTTLHALAFVMACVVLVIVAQPGLQGPLVLDSVKLFALERLLDEHGNLALFHTPGFDGGVNRIVSMASFVLDAQIQGGISPARFKATNVGLHVAAAVLVYFLVQALVRVTQYRDKASALALATSVIWLLSPVNFNVVMYAVQRMAMLSTLFVFAGLLLYVTGRLRKNRRTGYLSIALGAIVCLPLAVLSKQNGALLVPLAFLVEVYLLHPARPWFTRRQLIVAATVGAAGAALAAPLVAPGIFDFDNRDFTLLERLLSQPRALTIYAGQLLVPLGADTGVYTDGFARSTSLVSPISTLFALVACLVAIALAVRLQSGKFRLVGFGLAFFFVGHALESSVIPLELYFQHRNYLPDFGLYLALASFVAITVPGRNWGILAVVVYGGYFAAVSHARSQTWSSRPAITTAAVLHNPQSARAWSGFSQLATDSGQFDLAEQGVNRAIELAGTPNTRVQRLFVLCSAGKEIPAGDYAGLAESRRFGVSNELSQALTNLLQLYETNGCGQLRVPALVESLDQLASRHRQAGYDPWTVEYYADSFLYVSGNRRQAHRRLKHRLDSGHLESGLYRLELLIDEGNDEDARELIDRIRSRFDEDRLREYEPLLRDIENRVRATPTRMPGPQTHPRTSVGFKQPCDSTQRRAGSVPPLSRRFPARTIRG